MKKKIQIQGLLLGLAIGLSLILFGCKNDDPATNSGTVRIDIQSLKSKLYTSSQGQKSSRVPEQEESDAQDAIRTLIILPLTYANHGEPYSAELPVTETVKDHLGEDLPNSLPFVSNDTFISLPTDKDFVEFEIPKISDGWQVVVIASKTDPRSLDDLETDEHKDSGVYFGFTSESYTDVDTFNNSNVSLTIKRACLVEIPPKGCATFNEDKEAVVTAAVEILGVQIDGVDQSSDNTFPWIVRSSATGNEISATDAKSRLDGLFPTDTDTYSKVTVITSHQKSTGQSSACTNLGTSNTSAQFEVACGTQEYSFIY